MGNYWSANEYGDFLWKKDKFVVNGHGEKWVEGEGRKNCGSMIQSEKASF